jgi:hypothetical protein
MEGVDIVERDGMMVLNGEWVQNQKNVLAVPFKRTAKFSPGETQNTVTTHPLTSTHSGIYWAPVGSILQRDLNKVGW